MKKQPPAETNAPKIEFPCVDFPIKVMGSAGDDFQAQVMSTLADLGVVVNEAKTRASTSRNARFTSLTVLIVAESPTQLSDLNIALRKLPSVKLVL
ncbi:MAG: DUF493 domain-containing protein [Natronospirillum sp.]